MILKKIKKKYLALWSYPFSFPLSLSVSFPFPFTLTLFLSRLHYLFPPLFSLSIAIILFPCCLKKEFINPLSTPEKNVDAPAISATKTHLRLPLWIHQTAFIFTVITRANVFQTQNLSTRSSPTEGGSEGGGEEKCAFKYRSWA